MIPNDSPAGGVDVLRRVSHYALLSGLSQLIPIPFADDAVDKRVRRNLVAKLLRGRGRTMDVERLSPLYENAEAGIRGSAKSAAKALLIRPFKRVLRKLLFVTVIRKAVLETAEALLLGHTLDRLLAAGWFPDDATDDALRRQSVDLRRAIEDVMKSPERRGLTELVRQSARLARRRNEPKPPAEEDEVTKVLPARQRHQLGAAEDELARELRTDRGRSVFAALDRAVDRRLGRA